MAGPEARFGEEIVAIAGVADQKRKTREELADPTHVEKRAQGVDVDRVELPSDTGAAFAKDDLSFLGEIPRRLPATFCIRGDTHRQLHHPDRLWMADTCRQIRCHLD